MSFMMQLYLKKLKNATYDGRIRVSLTFIVLFFTTNPTVIASDVFVPSYPRVVFDTWLKDVSAQQIQQDLPFRKTIVGQSYIRTYLTNLGIRKLEIHHTHEGRIYDIGEFIDLGPTASNYIPYSHHVVLSRYIWAILTRNEPYIRSLLASEYILVESSYLGSKEEQILQFIRSHQHISTSDFYIQTVESESFPVLVSNLNKGYIRLSIQPTLDVLLQGQSTLLQEYLKNKLLSPSNFYNPETFPIHRSYNFISNENEYSFKLPEREQFNNEKGYRRALSDSSWLPTIFVSEMENDSDPVLALDHRWSTLALSKDFRNRDLAMAADFDLTMVLEGKEPEYLKIKHQEPIDWLGDVIGRGLPAYYKPIRLESLENGDIQVSGIWVVIDPDLAYEHIFRINDVLRLDDNVQYLWMNSTIRGILGVRMDHLQIKKFQAPRPASRSAIFKINAQ